MHPDCESCLYSSSPERRELRLTLHSTDRFHPVSVLWQCSHGAAFELKLLMMSGMSWRSSALPCCPNYGFALIYSPHCPPKFTARLSCSFWSLTTWTLLSAFVLSKCLQLPLTSGLLLNVAHSQCLRTLFLCVRRDRPKQILIGMPVVGNMAVDTATWREEGCTVKEVQRDYPLYSLFPPQRRICTLTKCWISVMHCAAHVF